MSIPISQCLIFKAAKGDDAAYRKLVSRSKTNFRCGRFSLYACGCEPPCEWPTTEQFEALERRLEAEEA